MVQLLLEEGADINARGDFGYNALQATSLGEGHEKVIQLLLEKGANVNAQGGPIGTAGTALHTASSRGHEKIVRLLLEKGANADAQDISNHNSLHIASLRGHEKVVQLLLEEGVNVKARGESYNNALRAASWGGHEKVIQLLLKKGANVNAQDKSQESALKAASYGGHEKVVQLLLEEGANVNAQDRFFGDALTAASLRGHEKVVQLLLKEGADIHAQSAQYGNALIAASSGGHEKVVQLLLEEGADVHAQSGHYENALIAASYKGHEKVVQLLLKEGADIHAQSAQYGNALKAASSGGHEKVVQLLLEERANVHAQSGYYKNALIAASSRGHEKVVQLLLEEGADVNAQGGSHGNALTAASSGGHEKVVQLLLEEGADIHAQSSYYGNALIAASSGGHEKVVQLLLEERANVHAQSGYYKNALIAASSKGHEKVVQLLLDREADVNTQGGDSSKVLQAAPAGGLEKAIRRPHGKGAEVNAQDKGYNNALQAALYASPGTLAPTGSAEAGIGPAMLRTTIDQGFIGAVQRVLDSSFDTVALADFEWLRDLQELGYASEEIAELLVFERYHSPWICFEPCPAPEGSISLDFHQPNCVHREQAQNRNAPDMIRYNDGIEAIDPNRSELLSSAEDDITYLIERLCGLAGILPTIRRDQLGRSGPIDSREPIITLGQVVFTTDKKPLSASVTYCPTDRTILARRRQDEEILGLGLKIPLDDSQRLNGLLKDLIAPLQKFCSAVAAGQKRGLCCDSFTILKMTGLAPSEPTPSRAAIELCRIEFYPIVSLLTNLECIFNESIPTGEWLPLIWEIVSIAECLCRKFNLNFRPSDIQTEVYHRMLRSCSLAVQLLNLGFVLYVRAHIGPLHACFLDGAIGTFHLYGVKNIETNAPEISVKLQRFTCLDDMLEHPVLVFSTYQEDSEAQQSYDLLTTAEDLVDTWGPGKFLTNDPDNVRGKVASIMIGGGSVKPVAESTNVFHWSRDISPLHAFDARFDARTKLHIGQTVLENEHCTLVLGDRWPTFRERLEPLGTNPRYWSFTEFQAGLMFIGQQFVGGQIQFNKTWTWHEGTNWKKRYLGSLDGEVPYHALDQPWGLQVSFCTGVARRVPLRVLVADVLPAFAHDLPITPSWAQLREMGIVEALKGNQLRLWLEQMESRNRDLKPTVERIIRYVLIVLRDTGIDRTNERLIIACRQDIVPDTPMSMCVKVPCEKATLWAKVLADSEQCATFACMTSLCFETEEHRCQRGDPWHCPSLKTAVCRHLSDGELSRSMTNLWNLRDQDTYWIGKPEFGLQAKVSRICRGQDPRLLVSVSRVSEKTLARLGSMSRIFKHQKRVHIREKLIESWPAEDVVILSEFPGRPE